MPGMTSCGCGAPAERVVVVVQRSGRERLTHHRCEECLREWTVDEIVTDASDPIDSDEVIAAHEALADPGVRLEDLL